MTDTSAPEPPLTVVSRQDDVTATLTLDGEVERHTGTLITFDNGGVQFVWEDARGVAGYLVVPASDIAVQAG